MNKTKSWLIAVAVGLFVPAAIWAANQQFMSPSTVVNCSVGNACNITANAAAQSVAGEPVSEERSFGSAADVTTNWTAGAFSQDLTVAGTTTASGEAVGLLKTVSTAMSTGTTTACTLVNNTGFTRTIVDIGVQDRGTAVSLGETSWRAGTSTSQYVAPTIFHLNTDVFRRSGVDAISATSSANTTSTSAGNLFYPIRIDWATGTRLNFISGTTTNAGFCKVAYY